MRAAQLSLAEREGFQIADFGLQNWPGMIAPLMAQGLANSYLPGKEQTAGRTFQRYGLRIGLNTGSNLLRPPVGEG